MSFKLSFCLSFFNQLTGQYYIKHIFSEDAFVHRDLQQLDVTEILLATKILFSGPSTCVFFVPSEMMHNEVSACIDHNTAVIGWLVLDPNEDSKKIMQLRCF